MANIVQATNDIGPLAIPQFLDGGRDQRGDIRNSVDRQLGYLNSASS